MERPKGDLSWTGNHFLDESVLCSIIHNQVDKVLFTQKGPLDSEPLREALALYHGIDSSWIAVGVGSSQILDALLCYFSGYKVIDIVPNFYMTRLTAERIGLAYQQIPVRNPEELVPTISALKLSKEHIVVLSSPRNPLGYSFSEVDIIALIEICPGPIVVDEAYVDFSTVNLIPLLKEYPKLVLVRTFSKAWGLANLRIGYAMSRLVQPRFRKEYLLPYNVGELGQRVACQLLQDPEPVYESVRKTVHAREYLLARLREFPSFHVWHSDANFVCVEHPLSANIVQKLAVADITVAQLHGIRNYPEEWPKGMRIAIAPEHIERRLIEVLKETHASC